MNPVRFSLLRPFPKIFISNVFSNNKKSLEIKHITFTHRLYGPPIPLSQPSMYVSIASRHRGEGFKGIEKFMDGLKEKVPIWKREGGGWNVNREWKGNEG